MMKTYKHLIVVFLTLFSCHSMAEVYKCKNAEGKVTFQDKHCPEESAAEVVSSTARQPLCYTLTGTDGTTVQVESFWTQQQKTERFITVQINKKKAVFSPEQIESISLVEMKDDCAVTKLVNSERQSFDALICDDIQYLSDKGAGSLPIANLNALQNCQSNIHAHGFWSFNGKKYSVQSAYVSYSKTAHQLKVTLFPFALSKAEEEGLLKADIVEAILRNRADSLAIGMIFKLREKVTDPQINDVTQIQSFVSNSQTTSVRSYDQNWRQALTLKQFHLVKAKQGKTAQINWVLTDRDQQANINVSATVAGDKF
jgi:hypothetical protein